MREPTENTDMYYANFSRDAQNDVRNRFTVAMKAMMRHSPAAEFANDHASVLWTGGNPLTDAQARAFAIAADRIGRDVVYLSFEPGRAERGPKDVTVLAARDGVVHRYEGCQLWSPANDGGALLMVPGKGCFSWDGIALVPHESRPVSAIGEGVARARTRLRHASREVSDQEAGEYARIDMAAAA